MNSLATVSHGLTIFGMLAACLLAPLGNTTAPMLFVLLGALIGLPASQARFTDRLRKGFPLALLALGAWIPWNAAFSGKPAISLASGAAYMLVVMSSFYGARKLVDSSDRVRNLARGLFGAGSLLSVAYSVYSYHVLHLYRATAPFVGENALGTIDTMIIALALGFMLSKRAYKAERAFWGLLVLLTLYSLFISQSRGAFVGLGASLLVFALYGREGRFVLVGGTLATGTAMAVLPSIRARIVSMTNLAAVGDRIPAWKSSLNMIMDHPIAGIGLGMFIHEYPAYRLPESSEAWLSFAHNIFLQVWVELGTVGIVLFVWLIGSVYWKAMGTKDSGWFRKSLVIALTGALVHDLFDCITYGLEIGGFFWILAGLAWARLPRSAQ